MITWNWSKGGPKLFVSVLALALAGCESTRTVEVREIGGGFREVVCVGGPPTVYRTALKHVTEGRLVTVWPDNGSAVVKGDTAIFIGQAAYGEPPPGESYPPGQGRVFAIKPPGRLLDITAEVVGQWAKQARVSGDEAQRAVSVRGKEERAGGLEFQVAVWPPGDPHSHVVSVTWEEVFGMMRKVEQNGVERRDPVWHITYLDTGSWKPAK